MFCTNCGYQLSETAKFCKRCGAPVSAAPLKPRCPSCGTECETDAVYCEECGTHLTAAGTASAAQPSSAAEAEQNENTKAQLNQNPVAAVNNSAANAPKSAPVQQAAPASVQSAPSNAVLASVYVSWYRGEKKLGIADATGKLKIYADRVEMEKQFGNSAAALNVISLTVSAIKASKEANMVFKMNQISLAYESTYSGIYPALVIKLKSGEKHTFSGTVSRVKIQNCVRLINNHKQ